MNKPNEPEALAVPAQLKDLREIALLEINASGPVSFREVMAYCRKQVIGTFDDYQVAGVLNDLMRAGLVELYDDGTSFNPAGGNDLLAALKKLLPYAEQRRQGLSEFLGRLVDGDIADAKAAIEKAEGGAK